MDQCETVTQNAVYGKVSAKGVDECVAVTGLP